MPRTALVRGLHDGEGHAPHGGRVGRLVGGGVCADGYAARMIAERIVTLAFLVLIVVIVVGLGIQSGVISL